MKHDRCEICDFVEDPNMSSGYNILDYEGNHVRRINDRALCDDCIASMKFAKEDNGERK